MAGKRGVRDQSTCSVCVQQPKGASWMAPSIVEIRLNAPLFSERWLREAGIGQQCSRTYLSFCLAERFFVFCNIFLKNSLKLALLVRYLLIVIRCCSMDQACCVWMKWSQWMNTICNIDCFRKIITSLTVCTESNTCSIIFIVKKFKIHFKSSYSVRWFLFPSTVAMPE